MTTWHIRIRKLTRFSSRPPICYSRAVWKHATTRTLCLERSVVSRAALWLWLRQMPRHCESSRPSRPALQRAVPFILQKLSLKIKTMLELWKNPGNRWEESGWQEQAWNAKELTKREREIREIESCGPVNDELQIKIQAVDKTFQETCTPAERERQERGFLRRKDTE